MPRPLRAALTGGGSGSASDASRGRFLRPDRKQVQVDCGDSAPARFLVFELADQALPSRPTNNHLSWIIPLLMMPLSPFPPPSREPSPYPTTPRPARNRPPATHP